MNHLEQLESCEVSDETKRRIERIAADRIEELSCSMTLAVSGLMYAMIGRLSKEIANGELASLQGPSRVPTEEELAPYKAE